jgi:hypothetical protein
MNQTIEIKISAKWGSEFQRSIAYQTIIVLLKAWVAFRRSTLAKNNITLVIDGKDIDDVQPDGI